MKLSSSDPELGAALFRFVDVAPACRSNQDRAEHLLALLAELERPAAPVRALLAIGDRPAVRAALGAASSTFVRHMARRFIAGESLSEAAGPLAGQWAAGVACSVDLLGEATVTAPEADDYAARCDQALRDLARITAGWPARPILETDSWGSVPRANLSVKLSALSPLLRPEAPELGRDDAARRLRPLLRVADAVGAHLHVDIESFDSREAIVETVLGVLGEAEFREGPSVGVVLQAYLRDADQTLSELLAFAGTTPRAEPLQVRLVKGAYWDHEVALARQHGWSVPVFEHKAESDRSFEALTRRLVAAQAGGTPIRVAIGSHNLRSVAHAIAANRAAGAADHDLELQVLRGLGDPLAEGLATLGMRTRAYSPVGGLVAGMAYLVRRLLENSSQDSFLRAQASGMPLRRLLAAP